MIPESCQRLIESLQNPTAIGEEAGDVQLLQTHMSWVLLGGPHAYKIKKPIDLGFVDFSTLERRHHFCREELRINRRLTPALYLDVVPICGTPDQPVVDTLGKPIEYAVKMKRFPQDARLDRVLQRNELDVDHIDRLLWQVADFHSRVEVDVDGRAFGTPEAVRKPMETNFEKFPDVIQQSSVAAALEYLKQWSEEQFERRKDNFICRKQDGFVRECHGDMHLGNMIFWNDDVSIFDAIEFNENLRWIDVQNELAFLVMDLEDRGRADFARRALNGYLEITGDYAGLTVLPYYLVYRAMVRAKVAGIRLEQKDVDAQTRQPLHEEIAGYVRLADHYRSAPTPKLILTHGVAASGKTTGSQRLVETLGAVRIRSDVERKRLFGLPPHARTDSSINEGLYSSNTTRRCYARLAALAETALKAGFTVVIDAAFLAQEHRTLLARTAQRLRIPWLILAFHADDAILHSRVLQRNEDNRDASEAGPDVLNRQLSTRQPLTEGERKMTIDVNSAAADWLDTLTDAVKQWAESQ